eukprot:RCo047889
MPVFRRGNYTSFETRGRSALPRATRSLNLSQFEESVVRPQNSPAPWSYHPQDPTKVSKAYSLSRVARVSRAFTPTASNDLGPGQYTPQAPFATFDNAPRPRKKPAGSKPEHVPSRVVSSNYFGEVGEVGQVINGKVLRTGIPGPQKYCPSTGAVHPACHSTHFGRSERFPAVSKAESPGPGAYDDFGACLRESTWGCSLPRNNPRERFTSAGQDLHAERLGPGPGYYTSTVNYRGKGVAMDFPEPI